MLNVRIVKGGCRGREAVKFGVVGLKLLYRDFVVNKLIDSNISFKNTELFLKTVSQAIL